MIKVFIQSDQWRGGLSFYITEQNEFDHKRYLLRFGKHNITREELKEVYSTEIPEPTFFLGQSAAQEFLKEMAEKAAERGIKLESDLKREGKLEATEKHLEDMRKLVFKQVIS